MSGIWEVLENSRTNARLQSVRLAGPTSLILLGTVVRVELALHHVRFRMTFEGKVSTNGCTPKVYRLWASEKENGRRTLLLARRVSDRWDERLSQGKQQVLLGWGTEIVTSLPPLAVCERADLVRLIGQLVA